MAIAISIDRPQLNPPLNGRDNVFIENCNSDTSEQLAEWCQFNGLIESWENRN